MEIRAVQDDENRRLRHQLVKLGRTERGYPLTK
jgi:hypothetical protein